MFFSWVSTLVAFARTIYESMIGFLNNGQRFRLVTINMGGRTKNPFEYLFKTKHEDSFYSYKKIFKTVKKQHILDVFLRSNDDTFKLNLKKKYNQFVMFLDSSSVPDDIFSYFFTEENDSKKKLTLDSKYGRQDDGSDGVRFNPVEHGYDKVPYSNFGCLNQFEFTCQYAESGIGVTDLVEKCMKAAEDNEMDFSSEEVCNLVLFDIMNIMAVYNSYTEFKKIYIPKSEDSRIRQVTDCDVPCIIATQEKKINEPGFQLLASSSLSTGGTHIYSYRFNKNDLKVIKQEETNEFLGNSKGICLYLQVYGKLVKLVSLHTKDPSKIDSVSCLDEFVEYGLSDLVSDIPTVIMGDFNPGNNLISNDIKTMMKHRTGCSVYPDKNTNTTKKVRSGYCAQMSKMFKKKNSEVSKDMIFYRGIEKYCDPSDVSVYPDTSVLLSDKWCGDHSAVWMTFDFGIENH